VKLLVSASSLLGNALLGCWSQDKDRCFHERWDLPKTESRFRAGNYIEIDLERNLIGKQLGKKLEFEPPPKAKRYFVQRLMVKAKNADMLEKPKEHIVLIGIY
jgi:hypothetical protein